MSVTECFCVSELKRSSSPLQNTAELTETERREETQHYQYKHQSVNNAMILLKKNSAKSFSFWFLFFFFEVELYVKHNPVYYSSSFLLR